MDVCLDALIHKLIETPNDNFDGAAVDAFCVIIEKEANGPQIGSKLLAGYIQSSDERTALQALRLLDIFMKRCGHNFQVEIGKFRFLNEMVKLVSPKYLGTKTSPAVREKVIELLRLWSQNYTKEVKIKEAYEMLKIQGIVKDDWPPTTTTNNNKPSSKFQTVKKTLFEDEETAKLLQELLQSKDPFELQLANRLIKSMVKDDERKVQQYSQKHLELEAIRNNVKLLSEMLDSYDPKHTSPEDIDLIRELSEACENFKSALLRLADEMHDAEDMFGLVLSVNDELRQVLETHASKINNLSGSNVNKNNESSLLLDISSPLDTASSATNSNGDNELMNVKMEDSLSNIDLLGEIFDTKSETVNPSPTVEVKPELSDANIMQPVVIASKITTESLSAKPNAKSKGLEELEEIGRTLLQQSLPSNAAKKSSFNLKNTSTTNLSSSQLALSSNNQTNITDNFLLKLKINEENEKTDDVLLLSEDFDDNKKTVDNKTKESDNVSPCLQSLADINVTLEEIKPSSKSPINLINKNNINVTLHFTEGYSRTDISVFVIKTINNNSKTLSNYLLQAVVLEGFKCRLQQPSSTELPGFNSFLPSTAIVQLLLVANPRKVPISLKFMLSYVIDREILTEMAEVDNL